ncbi:MAG: aminoacyl-tRNA hydrolase [Limnochordia bacterium]|jgi:PTH1 family peptidyl-tRNA hydrolase|nr:aminoacyl-tRNA hydrolase [Limnochordia bacterium]
MKYIVGLGNPGKKYAKTRHNMGFLVLDQLANEVGIRIHRRGYSGRWAEGDLNGTKFLMLKPTTYMNNSGESVLSLCKNRRIEPEQLLVVYDDLDLTAGRIRLRAQGRAGSHRGLQSIIEALGTSDFPRLRIGIGPVPEGMVGRDFVLSEPSQGEWADFFIPALDKAVLGLSCWLKEGIETAMNKYNG